MNLMTGSDMMLSNSLLADSFLSDVTLCVYHVPYVDHELYVQFDWYNTSRKNMVSYKSCVSEVLNHL